MAISSTQQTVQWLQHFGYLRARRPTDADYVQAVVRMQQVYGIVVDGYAGPVTRRAMGLFRCACRDHNLHASPLYVDAKHCKWQKPELTYAVGRNFTLAGNRDASIAILRKGFKLYEPLTGLTFREVTNWNTADIRIGRGRGRELEFDGPGNVLAWAQMPCASRDVSLLAMFDDSEPWSLKTHGAGVYMLAVWAHELGHLLGLDHSGDSKDLMAPYYNPQVTTPQLGDRKRLARIYNLETEEEEQPEEEVETPTATDSDVFQVTPGIRDGKVVVRSDGGLVIEVDSFGQPVA